MKTQKVTISATEGLHARPAGELVKLVKSFAPAKVTIGTDVKTVNAASMLSLLSLGLKCGSEVTLTVDGGDEDAALAATAEFIANFS